MRPQSEEKLDQWFAYTDTSLQLANTELEISENIKSVIWHRRLKKWNHMVEESILYFY